MGDVDLVHFSGDFLEISDTPMSYWWLCWVIPCYTQDIPSISHMYHVYIYIYTIYIYIHYIYIYTQYIQCIQYIQYIYIYITHILYIQSTPGWTLPCFFFLNYLPAVFTKKKRVVHRIWGRPACHRRQVRVPRDAGSLWTWGRRQCCALAVFGALRRTDDWKRRAI